MGFNCLQAAASVTLHRAIIVVVIVVLNEIIKFLDAWLLLRHQLDPLLKLVELLPDVLLLYLWDPLLVHGGHELLLLLQLLWLVG